MNNNNRGIVFSVNISEKRGTIKTPVGHAVIGKDGIVGDSHYGVSEKHVGIISKERIDDFSKEAGRKISSGEFAENITTFGLDLSIVKLHDHFKIGDAELEVIQIGKDEEIDTNKVFRIIGKVVMVHEGLFCRVITPGNIAVNNEIIYCPQD
jgi:molybdopterin adenylyltransferase